MSYGGGYGGPLISGVPPGRSGRYGYGPSRYLFKNQVDIYLRAPVKDKDRATVPTYYLGGSAYKCSVQPAQIAARYDDNQAIIQFIPYEILFQMNPGLEEYAYVLWVDDIGKTHKIIVIGTRSYAGLGVVFCIDGEERV